VGLPTLFAISRASKFLAQQKVRGDINLIATGGLITPGNMLKAMAMGADAVYIGTAALMAMVCDQMVETMPFEPPTSLIVYTGKMTDQFDIDKGATSLFKYLNATVREMEQVAVTLGKTALSDISKSDICCLDPFIAKATGIELGYTAPYEQKEYFKDMDNVLYNPNAETKPEETVYLQ
jgi:glutamate synthase domain-containing protein 2